MTRWVRKYRGGVWGPWHQWTEHQTRCGRRMPGIVDHTNAVSPPKRTGDTEVRYCDECLRLAAANKTKPYRRH